MLKNLKVLHKVILLAGFLLLSICVTGFIGYYFTGKANADMTSMFKDRLLPIEWLNDCRTHSRANEANLLYIIFSGGNKQEIKSVSMI